jgi:hypothetical protein
MAKRPLLLCLALMLTHTGNAGNLARFTLVGEWEVQVTLDQPRSLFAVVHVDPPPLVTVASEGYTNLPLYNANAAGWIKGAQLHGVQAQECTVPNLLDAPSLILRGGAEPDSVVFQRGEDYGLDPVWGTFGRLTNGIIRPDQAAFATYRHCQARLDAVVLTIAGQIVLRPGKPRAAAPVPPRIDEGEIHLGNIWLPGRITKLAPDHLFPILESTYPESAQPGPTVAERLLPRALQKLQSGEPLRLLAWGDSVTVGTFVPDWEHNRWQEQFVTRLRQRFPRANIELVTEAWGGRNTSSYLAEPPGSLHNYREKVLGAKPDLIVSEFVNDAGLNIEQVEERCAKLLVDFQAIGAEWIILTPHYVRPDWMGLTRERDIDEDPRPYVAGLRQFAAKHAVALADASRRYGRLWRQGIPYNTLMLNAINHPDARGLKLFADALMELFPNR